MVLFSWPWLKRTCHSSRACVTHSVRLGWEAESDRENNEMNMNLESTILLYVIWIQWTDWCTEWNKTFYRFLLLSLFISFSFSFLHLKRGEVFVALTGFTWNSIFIKSNRNYTVVLFCCVHIYFMHIHK